jgi:hypothetical protein
MSSLLDILNTHSRAGRDRKETFQKKLRKRARTEALRPQTQDADGNYPGLTFTNIDDTSATIVWENNTEDNSPDDGENRQKIFVWISNDDGEPYSIPTHIVEPDELTIVGSTGESYEVRNLEPGMTTYAWVRFRNNYGESSFMSGIFETTNTPVTIPKPPENRTTTGITTDSAVLNWDDLSNNEDGFKVYFTNKIVLNPTRDISPILKPPGTTSHTFSGTLVNNTTYYWWVSAYNSAGENYIVAAATFNTGAAPTPLVATELELGSQLAPTDPHLIVTPVSNPQQKVRVPIRGELIEINGEIIQVDRVVELATFPLSWRLHVTRRDPASTTQAPGFPIRLSIPTPHADTGFLMDKDLSIQTGGPGILGSQSTFIIIYDRNKAKMRLQRGDSIIIDGEAMRIFDIFEQVDHARVVVDRPNPVTHLRPLTPYIVYRDSSS